MSTSLALTAKADIQAVLLFLWAKFDTDPNTFLKQVPWTLKDFKVPGARC